MISARLLIILLGVILTPTLVFAAPQTFRELMQWSVTIMNLIVPILIVCAIIFYFWGITENILDFGKDPAKHIKNFYGWGLLALFLMVSIWGILNLLNSTFMNAGRSTPQSGGVQNIDCAYGEC